MHVYTGYDSSLEPYFKKKLYTYHLVEGQEVQIPLGKVDKQGIVKWDNDTPPEGIDIEYIEGVKGWIDSNGNIQMIDRKYLMTSERFEYLAEELRNCDFSNIEVVKTLVECITEKVPIYVRRRNHLDGYPGAASYIEVGYLNARGDIFYNEPPKSIEDIDINNLLTTWGGFHTMEDKGAIKTPSIKPHNHTGELLAQYNKKAHESWNPESIGFFKDGKATYWSQYDTYTKE